MPPTLPTSSRATRSRFSSPLQSIGAAGTAEAASTSGGGSASTRNGGSTSTSRSNGTSGHTGIGGSNAQRAMMARWLEPPVQSKTSFEEAGFQRHGVFEGMAPLGTLPKAVNVAKRISGLPEEKQYREGSPSNSRQTAKQQPKKKELHNNQDRQGSQELQPQDGANGEDHGNDGPAAHTVVEEQEDQEEQQEQAEEQPVPPSQTKKIILKRPGAAKHRPTRIIVGPRRSTHADAEAGEDESAEEENASSTANAKSGAGKTRIAKKESLPTTPTTPNTPTTPSTRRSIIFRPAPEKSQKQTRATRQKPGPQPESSLAKEDEADDADHSDQEAGKDLTDVVATKPTSQERAADETVELEVEQPVLEKPKPVKRPVGRPKSRRSLAAETRALKEKEQAQPEAAAEAGAEVDTKAPATPAPEVTEQLGDAYDTEQEGEVLDSDGDSFDSKAEDNDGYGGKTNVFDSSHLPLVSSRAFLRPRSDSNATEVNREVTDKVVDLAVEEALRHNRYPTAWALRTLYDEQAEDQGFLTMVEDVFQQTAGRETLDTFVRMVHEKKKEGKKDNKGCHHFVPPSTDSDFTLPKPIPAPYGDLITMDLPRFRADGSEIVVDDSADDDSHAKKRVKLTKENDEQHSSAAEAPSVAMHTFAPPHTSVSLHGGDAATTAESTTHGVNRQSSSTPRKITVKTNTASLSPEAVSSTPKTPTKTPRRPGRPPGSKNKTLAEKAAAAANTPSKKPAHKDEDPRVEAITPSSSQRRLRNRSGSTSSLSSAMSMSSPNKALRSRKDDDAAGPQQASDKASDKGDDVVMHDADSTMETSIGWTADTVQRKTEKSDGAQETQKKSDIGKDVDSKTSSSATQQSVKRGGGGGADRRARGGPGSGRGGRRRGAGRPPKNRALPPRMSPTVQEPEPTPAPTPAPEASLQPIATRNRSSAKKSPTPSSALISPLSSSSQNNTQTHTTGLQNNQPPPKRVSAAAAAAAISASAKEEMPAAVEDNISVRSVSVAKRAAQNGSNKSRSSTAALPSPALNSTDAAPKSLGKSESGDLDEERLNRMRREARSVTNSLGVAPESFTRGDAIHKSADASSSANAASASRGRRGSVQEIAARQPVLETPQPQRQRQLRASTTATRTTRSARKRAFDEVDDDVSPRSASFPVDETPSTRLQTPVPTQQSVVTNAPNLDSRAGTPGPKSKKPRVGPRVKSSPVKKKTGTSAGMPRASGERGSPVANGAPNSQDDNDDYCASCGGSGDLVCCDGCTRSFHFNCVDPPLHEDRDLPDEWFCNVCVGRRNPAALMRYTGIFGALLNIMEKRNSSAFRLPSETRDYFEGVKTGADGEYEDIVVVGTSRTRPIIPCAFCGLWWHIDCLDPPMANPPVLRNWRCPAHADDILAKLPGQLGPAHRFRKIKGAPAIKPAFSRGMINNGFIEFNSDDDSSDNNSGWRDWQSFGRVQRIGARGVELDFLEQIRREQPKGRQRHARIQRQQELPQFRPVVDIEVVPVVIEADSNVQVKDVLHDRSFIDEAQAAHNLSALRSSEEQVDRSGDLINALLAQADASVISMMAQGSSLNIQSGSTLTQQDRTSLEAMRARIDFLLSNPVASASLDQPKDTAGQQDNAPELSEAPVAEAHEVPNIAMEDALADDNADQAIPETNEVMSLVSDNGENEDEDPPPITTPLNAGDEELNSAVWPVEHHGSSISDPDSGNGAIQTATKPELAATTIESFALCDHNNGKGPLPDAPELKNEPDVAPDAKYDVVGSQPEEQKESGGGLNDTLSPLATLQTISETAVGGDDKENEAVSERLDMKSEQQDGAFVSTETRTETNTAADK
ncbi:hypothetical protein SBRCBS47491_006753 [Sporothrix bragantina]|uniref:PHD-type domain-containing protein n=1 Tax=Sporothrix bragantina TaxID=671064 RepID=A0ABP0C7M4_9PEZI